MNAFTWSVADWLQASYICFTALGVLVTGFMAYWVVETVQTKVDTANTLKSHFAQEVKSLREEARTLVAKLSEDNKITASTGKMLHYSLQTHINDLLKILNEKYNIDKRYLKAYRSNIAEILEKDSGYTDSFKNGVLMSLSEDGKKALHTLSTKNDHLFNEILLKIYEQEN